MYLGDCCLAGVRRPMVTAIRALPNWTVKSAGQQRQGYALQTPHFQTIKPRFANPGDKYPVWADCGNKPGSGSPCNAYARKRFADLRNDGYSFSAIQNIMTREGSFKHYAGF